jgi:glycosyltransferase involved in cell wall biosynthesis
VERVRPQRLIAATGDPSDPEVMSGLPHHLWLHGRAAGVIDGFVTRTVVERDLRWAAWNMGQVMRGAPARGYRYGARHLRRLWLPFPDEPATILNCFQLYPEHVFADELVRPWFFVDQTLHQLFEHYAPELHLGARVAEHAIDRERAGYARADGIIVNSEWARRDLIDRYGVDPRRAFVVHQSANFTREHYERWVRRREAAHPSSTTGTAPLRLVFVGVQWRRKGLDRLLRALAKVNASGIQATLDIVGCNRAELPDELSDVDGVRWHGYLMKPDDEDRLLDLIAAADVGCLLSRAEAGGNCVREFHALGLAVLGTSAGGSAEQMVPGAGWVVDVHEDDGMIADRLNALVADRTAVERAKAAAWSQRATVQWEDALARIERVLEAHSA